MLNVFGGINKTKLYKINCHPLWSFKQAEKTNFKQKKEKCLNSTNKMDFN